MLHGVQRAFAVLLIIAVAGAANLHLPLVQTIAWARMYSCYRERFTPQQALSITLSGQYPCALCKQVQSAEKERNNYASFLSSERLLLLPLQISAITVTRPVSTRIHDLAARLQWPDGFGEPATPPPRVA